MGMEKKSYQSASLDFATRHETVSSTIFKKPTKNLYNSRVLFHERLRMTESYSDFRDFQACKFLLLNVNR